MQIYHLIVSTDKITLSSSSKIYKPACVLGRFCLRYFSILAEGYKTAYIFAVIDEIMALPYSQQELQRPVLIYVDFHIVL